MNPFAYSLWDFCGSGNGHCTLAHSWAVCKNRFKSPARLCTGHPQDFSSRGYIHIIIIRMQIEDIHSVQQQHIIYILSSQLRCMPMLCWSWNTGMFTVGKIRIRALLWLSNTAGIYRGPLNFGNYAFSLTFCCFALVLYMAFSFFS